MTVTGITTIKSEASWEHQTQQDSPTQRAMLTLLVIRKAHGLQEPEWIRTLTGGIILKKWMEILI